MNHLSSKPKGVLNNSEVADFAISLLKADSESEVVEILRDAGYWDNESCWRYLGDDENNFKMVGAQSAKPEPALVEKLVNSMDARLTAECLRNGINPESPDAPQSIKEARELFFSGKTRAELAKGITLAVTGARSKQAGMPCITITDTGEGQTPDRVPDTFMSIDKKNKLRIMFVQGKFNMGGTGALMFCGKQKIQLLITKRDPELVDHKAARPDADKWSVTVVRRQSPPEGPGQVRNPIFKYLAPVGADTKPNQGEVLRFSKDEMNLMPVGKFPYEKPLKSGSCIKLYDYDMRNFKGQVLLRKGLRTRLEALLPEPALPMRIHECRQGFRANTFETDMMGIRERLEDSKGDSLEPGYPSTLSLNVQGEPMTAKLYAFKKGVDDQYRVDQGIIFTMNGQSHGSIPKSFFQRNTVKMGYLANELMVVVDCSDISVEARSDLFKNSRDRLAGCDLRNDIERELERQISHHSGLKELRESRKREEVAEKLSDEKPLEDVIKAVLKSSPALTKMFIQGNRLSKPFKDNEDGDSGGGGGEEKSGKVSFSGKRHPSFFKFDKLPEGEELKRTYQLGRSCNIKMITDVENEYFERDNDKGSFYVEVVGGPIAGKKLTSSVNLFNGAANWHIVIPEEDLDVGDEVKLKLVVTDSIKEDPFENIAVLTTAAKKTSNGNTKGNRRKNNNSDGKGSAGAGSESGNKSKGKPIPSGIDLPEINKVKREGWEERGFDQYSACQVIDMGGADDDDDSSNYSFYINVDNIYLKTDLKSGGEKAKLAEAKFIYGNVLFGLALIHDQKNQKNSDRPSDDEEREDVNVVTTIASTSKALAPFLVPMIDYLGGLDADEVSTLDAAAEDN